MTIRQYDRNNMTYQHFRHLSCNTNVFFPFQPYDCQREYVDKVIEALSNKQHAILESPTGTGKTLSLLCSSLAWLQKSGEKSVIYYTSRTHMQLAQAAREMKRTAYARVPAIVIGSRNQMCLNDDVKSQSGDHLINRACRNAIAKNACSYYSNYEQKLEVMHSEEVHDIEDMLKFGRSHQCCPYYASKKIAETKASIVFMPYNYLLESSHRKKGLLRLENSVIIFDEAHNIESALKDSVSGSFTQHCLKTVQESCKNLPEKIQSALNSVKHGLSRTGYDPEEKNIGSKSKNRERKEDKINIIEELAEKLTNDKLEKVRKCSEELGKKIHHHVMSKSLCSIELLFDILRMAGVQYSSSSYLITTLDSMASFWSVAGVMNPALVARHVSAITSLNNVISLFFPGENLSLTQQSRHEEKLTQYYTAFLQGIYEESIAVRQSTNLNNWELSVWCLHPAIGLKKIIDENCINGPRSMIVTSGTLAPMAPIERDLETTFKVIKSFDHIISDEQLKIMVLGKSPNSYSLDSHFEATQKDEYAIELGKTFIPLFKVLPFGTLIFFQSYPLMNKVISYWKNKSNIWRDISSILPAYIEDKKQTTFLANVESYKRNICSGNQNSKAVFFGVCRGKLSEGVNLEGNLCRTVIMTGLPFPSVADPKVVATRKFHEWKYKDGKGSIWYSQQMKRALNQTIGRVIRNKDDFGILILCDPRFKNYKYGLSQWVQRFFPLNETSFFSAESEIKKFFSNFGIKINESATESVGAFEIGFASDIFMASPFSEASGSKSSSRSNNSSARSIIREPISPTVPLSAQERQARMVAQYRVDRETYERVTSKSQSEAVQVEPVSKRPRFCDIYSPIGETNPPNSQVPLTSTQLSSAQERSGGDHAPRISSERVSSSDSVIRPNNDHTLNENTTDGGCDSSHEQGYIPKGPAKSLNIFKKKGQKTNQNRQGPPTQSPGRANSRLVK